MFSKEEKIHISKSIAKIIEDLKHPEMGDKPIRFNIHILGAEPWSWADIIDPTTFEEQGSPENPNQWNEISRKVIEGS